MACGSALGTSLLAHPIARASTAATHPDPPKPFTRLPSPAHARQAEHHNRRRLPFVATISVGMWITGMVLMVVLHFITNARSTF